MGKEISTNNNSSQRVTPGVNTSTSGSRGVHTGGSQSVGVNWQDRGDVSQSASPSQTGGGSSTYGGGGANADVERWAIEQDRRLKEEADKAKRQQLDINRIAQEELEKAQADARKRNQEAEAKRNEMARRSSLDSARIAQHVDDIARQEVQNDARQRKDVKDRVAQISAEEVSADKQRRRDRHANELAENQAREQRLDDRTERIFRQVKRENRQNEDRRRQSEERSRRNINARTDAALDEIYEKLGMERAREQQERARRQRSDQRIDARTEAALREMYEGMSTEDLMRQLSNQRIDARTEAALREMYEEMQAEDADEESIRSRVENIIMQELLRDDISRQARFARERGLGMEEREPIDRSELDDVLPRFNTVEDMDAMLPDPGVLTQDEIDAKEAYENEVRLENEESSAGNLYSKISTIEQDTPWENGSETTGLSGDRAKIKKIIKDESNRWSVQYGDLEEQAPGGKEGNFDDQRLGNFPDRDYLDGMEPESILQKALRKARNAMLLRFLNPSLLRIESERVETRVEIVNGKKRTYSRLRYSDNVERAIGSIQSLYHCSKRAVMQLVQLRGGIGVDINGKVAKVDPDNFKLTDDQFIELCRDIVRSQKKNHHPLGPVDGTPYGGGVRDDTGKFVIVAGTRCFPLGYMPRQLIADLRRNWNSALHEYSEQEIQKMIGENWINKTYKQLCSNTGGNQMFQARAIENMMRALMAIDGADPKELKIPEIVERETLLMQRAETSSKGDPQIAEATKIRQEQDEEAISRFKHRCAKRYGARDENGNIQSSGFKRTMVRIDRAFSTLSNLQMASSAARTMIQISGLPEAMMAEGQMSVSNLLSKSWFKFAQRNNEDIDVKDYQLTDELAAMSQSNESVEARDVAESLYRSGGLDMMRTFLSEKGDDGHSKYKLTKVDFRRFLADYGIIGPDPKLSDKLRERLKVKPGEESIFLYNVQHVLDTMEDMMLGSSNLFKTRQSRQFVEMSLVEMGNAALNKRESYTNSQVTDWGLRGGGEEMIRSLLQTDAGLEAFMTQGVTSLGRKSPIQNQVRVIMGKSGVGQFAVRNMFTRFVEYGVNKAMRIVPTNTLSYIASLGIKSGGDFLARTSDRMPLGGVPNFANAMQRNFDYQVGSRLSKKEGLLKNLRYDLVMTSTEVGKALVVMAIVNFFGSLFPPEDKRDRFTLSEWRIGNSEDDAVPVKWAWWMDDLAGTGLPLGLCLAICDQGEWSPDAINAATNCFINQVANFNDGTAIFEAIDLVNNFDKHLDQFLGRVEGYDPNFDEWSSAFLEQKMWDLVGSVTPAFVGELIPWSKDYLFKGDADAHTPYKEFDAGGKYTMEEAQSDYHVRDVEYREAIRRRASSTNVLEALWLDIWKDKNDTSYKYAEMPLDTRIDDMAMKLYNDFNFDEDSLPVDQEERSKELYGYAESLIQWVDEHYQNADQANASAFVLSIPARKNAEYWCRQLIKDTKQNFEDKLKEGRLPNDEYYTLKQQRDDAVDHYYYLIDEFFTNYDIPWVVPRYIRQESDYETRYLDEQGNAANYLNTLGLDLFNSPSGNVEKKSYLYGNVPSVMPFSSPRTEGKAHNFETPTYWALMDENGNPRGDVGAMYDLAGQMGPITTGRNANKDMQELLWGGQGTNLFDGNDETLAIPREGVPTLGGGNSSSGGRPWRIMESTVPDSLKNADPAELLGLPPLDEEEDTDTSTSSSEDGGSSYGYSSYRPYYVGGGYSGGGYYSGGGSYSDTYNPRIYSNARQVNSDRAAGMATRQPYKATNTYLRPNFYTKGSREAYKRSDI